MSRLAPPELFSSRMALLLTAIGMAIGTGNIWRFPRILATNGGGTFLVPWLVFLFAWSIPLLIIELGLGRSTRRGCVGAVAATAGPRWAFMGAFVAFCSSAIMFYYAVVAGWCLRYLGVALRGGLRGLQGERAEQVFLEFAASPEPVLYQALALGLTAFVVLRGVVGGIEKANKVLIPALFLLMLLAAGRTLTLPGAGAGLAFIFTVDPAALNDVNIWLEGLSQSAWSTGAGWGLLLTYGVYVRRKESIVGSAVITGLGNNVASILAAVAIIPAVFVLAPVALGPERLAELGGAEGLLTAGGPASTGLTFIWLPALFERMPGGQVFTILFFLGLFFAALSSLIAMVEMASRVLMDLGLPRRRAVALVVGLAFLLGIPSATNLTFFQNQDWVWGLGLMLSGFLLALAVVIHGPRRFRKEAMTPRDAKILGPLFDLWVRFALPALFLVMMAWWFAQSISWDPDGWWNPFATFSIGTCAFQWGIVVLVLLGLNRFLGRTWGAGTREGESDPAA